SCYMIHLIPSLYPSLNLFFLHFAEYEFIWLQSSELPSPTSTQNTLRSEHTVNTPGAVGSYIQSAFSLTSMAPGDPESIKVETAIKNYSSLRRESRLFVSLSSGASSVLQSPDGNWIALQSSQHSWPSLLTKCKSLVFSVLEKESGVFCRRLSDETYYADSQHKPEWIYTQHPPVTSPSSGQYTNTEIPTSDSETSPALSTQTCRPAHGMPQKRSSDSHLYPPYRHPVKIAASLLLRPEALDVNFNPRLEGDSSDGEERNKQVKRSRRRRKSKSKTSDAVLLSTMMMRRQQSQENPVPLNYQAPDTVAPPDLLASDAMTPKPDYQNTVAHNSGATSPPMLSQLGASKPEFNIQGPLLRGSSVNETLEQELRSKLCELVGQVSEMDVMSSDFETIREVGNNQEDQLKMQVERKQERQREMEKQLKQEQER
uniref:Rab effector MyRIP/Melanophilin domain-containing protein n=1 Tax=Cyprinus carpio TaxID=7962 RepID=A0A8C2KQL0_CYPCA